MMEFEWDIQKEKANIRKHKISFKEAIFVFSDQNALTIPDVNHSDFEDRWVTLGFIPKGQIILVIHTHRIRNLENTIRIISARKATKKEMTQYTKSLE